MMAGQVHPKYSFDKFKHLWFLSYKLLTFPTSAKPKIVSCHFKKTPVRHIIILITLFMSIPTFGQLVTQNFTGQLEYDIKYFSAFITHDSCGDHTAKRTLIKKTDYFQAWDTSLIEREAQEYLPTKFFKDSQFLKLVYYNPTTKSNDTIDQFPLFNSDTITSSDSYLLYTDSLSSWNPSENKWHFKQVKISPDYSETTNIGDTTITVLGHLYLCYRFEKFHYNRKSNPGPSHIRKIIYIDKTSLLPLQEDWFCWYSRHPCKPTKKWVVTQTVQLKKIKIGN